MTDGPRRSARIVVLASITLAACGPTMDDRRPDPAARVRSYLDAQVPHRTPGLQYVAVDSAGPRLVYAGGFADVAHQVPMDGGTTLMAYSMSKTITAAAVLQLVQAGRVGLDDAIDRYVADNPYGPGVTVRELLAHTSGIPNPIPLRWVHLAERHAAFDERAALTAQLRAHPGLLSPPGTKYKYSNIGYWLLGRVVERASGEAFADYVTTHVLRPLGIAPTELGYVIPDSSHHAHGYLAKNSFMDLVKGWLIDRELIGDYEGRWLRIPSHYTNGPAFGGLVGTAAGFGKFLQDQLRGHAVLFDDATRALFFAQQRTATGDTIAMTLGWHIGSLHQHRFFYKEGGGGGFHALMRVYPDDHLATVVLANSSGFDVKGCLNAVDRILIGARP